MATRTISLREEAYDRLRRARKNPRESFSDVVMRAVWPDSPLEAGAFLTRITERGATYSVEELDRIDAVAAADLPPADKWPAG